MYIRDHVEKPVFYIFSDDLEYVREHYNEDDIRIVDWNTGEDSLYDMQLMSKCKKLIFSNSSFGTWAYLLNTTPGFEAIQADCS